MRSLRIFLIASTIAIYVFAILAINDSGSNWPTVYFGDLFSLDWHSQFNAGFLLHLSLLALWISWCEGSTPKGNVFGFMSSFLGGMFGHHADSFEMRQDLVNPSLPPRVNQIFLPLLSIIIDSNDRTTLAKLMDRIVVAAMTCKSLNACKLKQAHPSLPTV